MSTDRDQRTQALLAAVFRVPGAVRAIGDALWLYAWLVTIANASGLVCRTLLSLAKDLEVGEGHAQAWIGKLVAADLVTVETPAPYLVMKLRFWPGEGEGEARRDRETTAPAADARIDVPVSSSLLLAAAAEKQSEQAGKREEGGTGEGEQLLAEALEILGEQDAPHVRELVAKFPRDVVRRAMLRVKVTPPFLIRKSKLALFRYLLATFSQELHAEAPPRPT